MRRLPTAVLVCALLVPAPAAAAEPSPARALIERSIAYHDPAGVWWTSVRTIELRQPRAEGAERRTKFALYPDGSHFDLDVRDLVGGGTSLTMRGDSCATHEISSTGGGSSIGIECTKGRLYRDYYAYLFNLPMNLLDPGGTLAPEVIEKTLAGGAVLAVRITYGEGEPTWEHYFDPATGALVGCRFARDPEWKSGEFIVYTGEIARDGVRLPRERAWYYNDGGKWLGTDAIVELDVRRSPGPR